MQKPSHVWCYVTDALAKAHIPVKEMNNFFKRFLMEKKCTVPNIFLKGSFCLSLLPCPASQEIVIQPLPESHAKYLNWIKMVHTNFRRSLVSFLQERGYISHLINA